MNEARSIQQNNFLESQHVWSVQEYQLTSHLIQQGFEHSSHPQRSNVYARSKVHPSGELHPGWH